MRRRWQVPLLCLLLLAVAPGCRVLAGAAILIGEAAIEAAIDDEDSGDPPRRHERRAARPNPRRHAENPLADPCR